MTKQHEQAAIIAREYADLIARGDVVLAEQAIRTIDTLVGFRRQAGSGFEWPRDIAAIAGVPARRG